MLNTRVATLAISKRHNCPINSNRRYRAFRDKNRDPVPSTELRLALTDFVCGEYASSFEDVDDDVVISSMSLCEYLARAESSQNMRNKRLSKSDTVRPEAGILMRIYMGSQTEIRRSRDYLRKPQNSRTRTRTRTKARDP